jgi:aryl-alcohol dehydrogenase
VLCPQAGQALAVFGVGTVGLSAVMAAAMLGVAPLFAIDTNATRLVLAKELGATHVFNPTQDGDLLAWLSQLSPGGVQRAIDTTNNPTLLSQAFASLAKRGTLAHVGGGGKDLVFPGGPLLAGRTVTGVVQGDSQPQRFIPQLLDYYQQGRFPFDKLLQHYPFHAINRAVADMEAGRCIKPVLVFD